ncbi:hypothetical protein AB5I41_12445 [Sphingomonas sp. MMS24-JH45]
MTYRRHHRGRARRAARQHDGDRRADRFGRRRNELRGRVAEQPARAGAAADRGGAGNRAPHAEAPAHAGGVRPARRGFRDQRARPRHARRGRPAGRIRRPGT